ncbi:hypothetical protein DFH06DRAFT_1339893 [Mycena polygramma]|nr:hypothetical protein DFH06DRAFT_1339893 [Mycena polygramma]
MPITPCGSVYILRYTIVLNNGGLIGAYVGAPHPVDIASLHSPAEVAAKEEHFRIPGCSANMFIIILSLLARLADPAVDDQLVSIIRPCVTEMHLDAITDYRIVGGETEYHEYWKDGTLRPLYHEIDLIPEESSSYV